MHAKVGNGDLDVHRATVLNLLNLRWSTFSHHSHRGPLQQFAYVYLNTQDILRPPINRLSYHVITAVSLHMFLIFAPPNSWFCVNTDHFVEQCGFLGFFWIPSLIKFLRSICLWCQLRFRVVFSILFSFCSVWWYHSYFSCNNTFYVFFTSLDIWYDDCDTPNSRFNISYLLFILPVALFCLLMNTGGGRLVLVWPRCETRPNQFFLFTEYKYICIHFLFPWYCLWTLGIVLKIECFPLKM